MLGIVGLDGVDELRGFVDGIDAEPGGCAVAGHAGDLDVDLDAAAVAAVDLERGGLAGDDTVDVQAALREFVVDQADDADLLGGLFHDDEADHIVALEADALFLELRKDRAAVDLAGDAALGIGGGAAVDDLGLFKRVAGLVVHLIDVDHAAVGLIAVPFGRVTDVDMVHMAVVHDGGAGLGAVDDAADAAPGIAEHFVIAKLLKLGKDEVGHVLFLAAERRRADQALRQIDHGRFHFGCKFTNSFNHK